MVVQPRLAALQAPVLADRCLGQRASRAHGEEREGAERLVLGRRRCLEDVLRDDALGEVVEPLEVASTGDDEATLVPQRLQHHLRRLPVPHPAADKGAVRLELARAERPLGSNAVEHRLDEVAVVAQRALVDPQWPPPSMTRRKCGQSSIGRSDASCPQYSKTRPSRRSCGTCSGRRSRCGSRASAGARGRRPRSSRAVPPRGGVSPPRRLPRAPCGSAQRSPARRRSCGGLARVAVSASGRGSRAGRCA